MVEKLGVPESSERGANIRNGLRNAAEFLLFPTVKSLDVSDRVWHERATSDERWIWKFTDLVTAVTTPLSIAFGMDPFHALGIRYGVAPALAQFIRAGRAVS